MEFKNWVLGKRGRGLQVAQAVGVSAPVVSDWVSGKKGIPIDRCVAIERVTQGAVTRRDLRPQDWQNIWPELATAPANTGECAIFSVAQA